MIVTLCSGNGKPNAKGGLFMVSPELLRRYSFFKTLTEQQLSNLAMLSEEVRFDDQEVILEEGETAKYLYFLLEGCVDLYHTVEQNFHSHKRKEVPVGQINPGEPFGISTIIEPHIFTSTARSCGNCRLLRLKSNGLDKLFIEDPELEIFIMRNMAKAALERLNAARVQLAAAWS
jgi:CRP-like cAMP-binding protein